jgi:hypothetical protein
MAPTDPRLSSANFVFLRYCTNDAWVGSATAPLPGMAFSMLGRVYIDAVLQELVSARGLGAAPGTRVLFSGCSAGARGAMFNSHFVAGRLRQLLPAPANLAAFGSLFDSAYWVDIDPYSPKATPFRTQVQNVYAMTGAGAAGYLNPACTAAFPAAEGWKCMFGEYSSNYTQEDYMIHVYQFDLFQLNEDVGHTPATAAEIAYANGFQKDVRALASTTVLGPARAGTAALLPACYHHCNTGGSTFATATTDGVTLQDVVAGWFSGLPGGTTGKFVMEDCLGFKCGKGCP